MSNFFGCCKMTSDENIIESIFQPSKTKKTTAQSHKTSMKSPKKNPLVTVTCKDDAQILEDNKLRKGNSDILEKEEEKKNEQNSSKFRKNEDNSKSSSDEIRVSQIGDDVLMSENSEESNFSIEEVTEQKLKKVEGVPSKHGGGGMSTQNPSTNIRLSKQEELIYNQNIVINTIVRKNAPSTAAFESDKKPALTCYNKKKKKKNE